MILHRYLSVQLLVGILIALMVFSGIIILTDFVHFSGKINSNFSIFDAMAMTLYAGTFHIYELLPIAVLTGSLFIYGNLETHFELIAMRTLGYSRQWIIKSSLFIGCIFIIVTIFIGEVLVPNNEKSLAVLKNLKSQQGELQKKDTVIWTRDGNYFINATIDDNAMYHDVSIYDYDENKGINTIWKADTMEVAQKYLLLNQVHVITLNAQKIDTLTRERIFLERINSTKEGVLKINKPKQLNFLELIAAIPYLKESKQNYYIYELSLWNRINHLLSIIVLLIIVTPFIFSSSRNKRIGQRLFFGVLIGTIYTIVNQIFQSFSIIYSFPVWLGAFTIPILCLSIVGLWFFYHESKAYKLFNF